MIEKVNPQHPDKIADRVAGALVDLAYNKDKNPKIAVEVLIGHGKCHIIAETNVEITPDEANEIVQRIAGDVSLDFVLVPQDKELSKNQSQGLRCGDNGIFKGVPLTQEEAELSSIARSIYGLYPFDGKYILNNKDLIVCQSNADSIEVSDEYNLAFNPLGYWTGGPNVDTGATNRKLGSDMARSVTGGGLHGKDLSKADVSVNIYAFLEAQKTGESVELCCAIGDKEVNGIPYADIVEIARKYISEVGGFEKLAEWGLF
ncbi:S-adenosylmethionine synthetase N-terminal domain-containing protein [Streptococcus hyovaginalis]